MFHHFTDLKHPAGQGAISAEELRSIIEYIGLENILSAHEWLERVRTHSGLDGKVCLTFDDALRCQLDVALPVLKEFGLSGFWFVYTGHIFDGQLPRLELYRHFRITQYKDVTDFYADFFKTCIAKYGHCVRDWLTDFDRSKYPNYGPYYSDEDCCFRELRDQVLTREQYFTLMDELMARHECNLCEIQEQVMLSADHIRHLDLNGQVVGMHSHTHPTVLAALPTSDQYAEYASNSAAIQRITGRRPSSLSHPSNSYNASTLDILRCLGVFLGFRANMDQIYYTTLELPREDHSTILLETKTCE
jgi:peptidoglycan/xylan/chitin deacetylase (PgdA/CDA1 family)